MKESKPPISLLEGEKIIEYIKPLPAFKKYLTVTWSISWSLFLLIMIFSVVFIPIALIIIPNLTRKKYEKQHYWITNKRIILKRGLFGYRVSSIPLERISDVILSRSWLENLFGFGSIRIQSLAGQMTQQACGAEGNLMAIPEPEKTQQIKSDVKDAAAKTLSIAASKATEALGLTRNCFVKSQ